MCLIFADSRVKIHVDLSCSEKALCSITEIKQARKYTKLGKYILRNNREEMKEFINENFSIPVNEIHPDRQFKHLQHNLKENW